MKGCLKIVLVLLLFGALLAGLAAWLLPGLVIRGALDQLPGLLATQGIRVSGLQYASAGLAGWRGVSLTGVAFSFDLEEATDRRHPADPSRGPENIFDAEKITVVAASFVDPAVTLRIQKFNLALGGSPGSKDFQFHRFENATVTLPEPIRLRDALSSGRKLIADAKAILREGRIDTPFEFEGVAHFRFMGSESRARLYSVKENGATSLRFDEADVRTIARKLDIELGDREVTLIAANPLKMPGVLELTMTAKKTSIAAARSDPSVPEDAYRHVLWSYLLTERFGAEFAKVITDAHETVPGNTPDERAMDYHNNAVGRDLALRNAPRAELPGRVKTAPEIIRRPDEVRRRDPSTLLDQP